MTEPDPAGALFTRPPYLDALVDAGCVCAQTGWIGQADLSPLAWRKTHSWGEFVFDFEIARLYQRYGLAYYPKLLLAVPYTPVVGPRLNGLTAVELQRACEEEACSSVHVLFACEQERDQLMEAGWLRRRDMRFVWHNRGYDHFDGFLAELSSKKRKNIRAERRAVVALELQIEWCAADEIPLALWPRLYALYARTYMVRGQQPYLNEDCLKLWAERLGPQMQFCLAWQDNEVIAMAFYFRDQEQLYGRHWGSALDGENLHFELCYYQGIEYCIAQGLRRFDAGVQGGHRLLRGFEPLLTDSLHWYREPDMQHLLKAPLQHECEQIQMAFDDAQTRTAYRRSVSSSG